jgi:hypothetical protein
MSNNIYKQMLIQQDPQMFGPLVNQSQGQPTSSANMVLAEALGRGAAATPAATPAVAQQTSGADTLAKFKLQNQQRDAAARQKAINPGDTAGFGRYAPLAGALKGIASQYVRGQDNIKLEDAMQGYEQEQQRVYEQKLAQARLAREQTLQDGEIEHARAIALEEAKQANAIALKQTLAPRTPEEELALAQARILLNSQIQAREKAEEAAEVAVYTSASKKEGAEDRVVDGINIIDGLLNAEPEVGPTTAFPPLAAWEALTGSRTPLEQASGWESNLFTFNGSPAANAESALQRLRGMNFLDVIEEMKGSGTITEVEGQKGEAAMAALEESQSDEVIKQSLIDLQGILKKNLEISRAAPGPRLSEKPIKTATNPDTGEKKGLFRDGKWRIIE